MSLLVAFASQDHWKLKLDVCFPDCIYIIKVIYNYCVKLSFNIDIHVSGKQRIGRVPIEEKLQEIPSLKTSNDIEVVKFYFAAYIVLTANKLKSNFETVHIIQYDILWR